MEEHTTFTNRETLNKNLLKLANNKLQEYNHLEKLIDQDFSLLDKDSYHFITNLIKPNLNNRIERTLYAMLYDSMYNSELISAKTSKFCYLFGLNFLTKLTKHNIRINEESHKELSDKFKSILETYVNPPEKKDLKKLLKSICHNSNLETAIWEAIKLAGLEGKIYVENGAGTNYSVKLKEGYSFNVATFPNFIDRGKTWVEKDVKIFPVDGIIEKVSEIDQILNKAFETKQPMIIVALGFSEEVIATLKANYDRNLLNIIPIKIKTDLEAINMLNDICVSCNTAPTSPLMGQLLSCVDYDQLPTVNKAVIYPNKTVIENPNAKASVANQIKLLLKKRYDNRFLEDVQDLIDQRIKNLTSNSVIIQLPNTTKAENNSNRVKIDLALRQFKTMLNYGIVDIQKCIKQFEAVSKTERLYKQSLEQTFKDEKYVPMLSAFLGTNVSGKTAVSLSSAAGIVEIDEKL